MKPLRFVCCAGALFFAFMAGITAYAINSSYRQLTEVELSFAQRVENDRYAVPRSAVYTDQKGRSWLSWRGVKRWSTSRETAWEDEIRSLFWHRHPASRG